MKFGEDISYDELREKVGKRITVKCTDGDILEGTFQGCTSDDDGVNLAMYFDKIDASVDVPEEEIAEIEFGE